MTTQIGPNFPNELVAAGLVGLPISWSSDGEINYGVTVTDQQKAAVAAVVAAHDYTKPDPRQAYQQAIAAGCQIHSTATASLNGTYAIDDSSTAKITAIVAGINAGKGLPGGGETFNLLDKSGVPHAIGATDFLNLGAAIENYVYELIAAETTALAGGSWAAPAQPVTIP